MNAVKSFSEHQLIALQDDEWLERQRVAGRSVVFCLNSVRSMINNRIDLTASTLKSETLLLMKTFDCTQALDKERKYKSSITFYVNNLFEPVNDSYKFQNGDIIKIEIGANYLGAVAKATITTVKNGLTPSQFEMFSACKKSLNNAITQIKTDKRLGCLGAGINHVIKNTSFKFASECAGLGLDDNNLFADPVILSKSQSNSGIRIQEGMTFTIAPQISLNSNSKISCCFEKTIFVHKDSVEIITPWSEEN